MKFEKVFLTGASSGMGRALAVELAGPGVTLGLVARREQLLEELRQQVEGRGARALIYPVDVTDREAMTAAANAFLEAAGGCDLALADAGLGFNMARHSHYDTQIMGRLIDVNLKGVLFTLAPFIPHMLKQGAGRLAAVGSVAGFRAIPGGGYSATKTAVKSLIDMWRLIYGSQGLGFTTLCPGFVATPMIADDPFTPPFVISPDKAARLMRRALEAGKKTYVFPWQWRLVIPLMKIIPDALLRLTIKNTARVDI